MWGMASWSGADETEVKRALQRAVDLGCNFFDTAWAYGSGRSERLLGDLVRANPGQRLYTATKIPPRNQQWPSRRAYSVDDCYPPDHIEEYVRRSLANAGLPAFDLIQLHTWEDAWLSDGRLFEKLADLRRQGLFQGVGISLNRWEPWNGVEAVRRSAVPAVRGQGRGGDRPRPLRRGEPDRNADRGHPLAGGRLAQHLFRRRSAG